MGSRGRELSVGSLPLPGIGILKSVSRNSCNDDEIFMNAKEMIRIVKESTLWGSRKGKKEKEAIKQSFKSTRLSPNESDTRANVGEVYLELK